MKLSDIKDGMKLKGVIVYLPAARELFKVTLEHDEQPKSLSQAA